MTVPAPGAARLVVLAVLAVAAPVVMLIVLRGLLTADSLEEEGEKEASCWPPRRLRPLVRLGVPALTIAFAVAAAFSTLLPLRQSAVGSTAIADRLIRGGAWGSVASRWPKVARAELSISLASMIITTSNSST